jgi:branched-chain amino acid transport system substrate-binding protein
MKKLFLVMVAVLLVIAFIISGCNQPAPAPAPAPAPLPAPAPATIKIGVMYPLTGPLALTGERMVNAVKFAFEQAGGQVAGKKIEVIAEDSGEPDPSTVVDKARKLVEFNNVCALLGPLTPPGKFSVGSYMATKGVPQIATHFNLPNMSDLNWTFMSGGSSSQICGTGGLYAAKEMGFKTISCITFETGDARGFEAAFKQGFEKAGGQVIQEQFTPRPCSDFAPYLATLKDADAVAAWVDGADGIRFLTQYNEMGIRAKMPLTAIFFGSFFEMFILHEIPPAAADAMVGEKCATTYYTSLDTDINKQFVAAIKAKFGYMAEEADAGAYLGAQVVLNALTATGGDTTPAKLRDAIMKVDFMSPEGRIRFDPQTRFPIRDIYIIKIDKVGGEFAWVPVKTYKDVPPGGL